MNPDQLAAYLLTWRDSGILPLIVIAGYVLGSALFVPIFVLLLATAYVLDPLEGALCSFAGVVLGGMVGFSFGRVCGDRIFKGRSKRILEKVRRRISKHEITSVAIIRKLPIAPFTVVNMAIGALKIRASSFAIGTGVGMLPAILLISLLSGSYQSAMREHSWKFTGYAIFGTAAVIGATLLFDRIIKRWSDAH